MYYLWEYTELERRLNALCANTNGYLEFRSALPLFQISSLNWTCFFKFKFTAVCCLCRLGSKILVCWSARCLSVSMRSTTMVLARTWSAQNRKCREICLVRSQSPWPLAKEMAACHWGLQVGERSKWIRSLSTQESEIQSLSEATRYIMFSRYLLEELGIPQSPTIIYEDNNPFVRGHRHLFPQQWMRLEMHFFFWFLAAWKCRIDLALGISFRKTHPPSLKQKSI